MEVEESLRPEVRVFLWKILLLPQRNSSGEREGVCRCRASGVNVHSPGGKFDRKNSPLHSF
jgi:hypothetical protein